MSFSKLKDHVCTVAVSNKEEVHSDQNDKGQKNIINSIKKSFMVGMMFITVLTSMFLTGCQKESSISGNISSEVLKDSESTMEELLHYQTFQKIKY